MSWKSYLTAGLLCVLASPAFAAPTLTVTGSRLTKPASGTPVRVWNIAVTPDFTSTAGASTPLALELGFEATGGNILSINVTGNEARVPSANNPGNKIFGGETIDPTANNNPAGLQLGSSWVASAPSKAFAAIGTADFANAVSTPVNANINRLDLITITTDQAVTSLKWGGAYASGTGAYISPTGSLTGVARIAQDTTTIATNFHDATYTGTLSAGAAGTTRFLADMNGDGNANFTDLAAFGQALTGIPTYNANFPNLNRVGRGDINGDGLLNFSDLAGFSQILQGNNPGSGSGLDSGGTVPEPASFALVGLAALGALGVRRRR